jgi:hypothetical protein
MLPPARMLLSALILVSAWILVLPMILVLVLELALACIPQRNVENGFALFSMGPAAIIFGATLPPHFQSWQAPSAKRTNVAVRVEPQPIVVTSTTS